jgi:hypothetical protein
MPVWADALKAIDQSPDRIRDAPPKLYAFPEPALFVTPMNPKKIMSFLKTWLQAHLVILWRAEMQAMSALSNQTWRDFLAINFIQTAQRDDSKSMARREQLRKLLGSAIEKPGVTECLVTDIRKTQWWGVDLPSDEMPPRSMVQGILWELYELNFRFELIALDWRMSNGAHDNLIAACFPNSDGGMTFVALPLSTRGLAADDWHACLPYVKAFINVMYTWNVRHPQVFRYVEQLMMEDQFLELEKAAVCVTTRYGLLHYANLIRRTGPYCFLQST